MLTRVYGTAFPTKKELDEYLARVELAKQRDHRRLGRELGSSVSTTKVLASLSFIPTACGW